MKKRVIKENASQISRTILFRNYSVEQITALVIFMCAQNLNFKYIEKVHSSFEIVDISINVLELLIYVCYTDDIVPHFLYLKPWTFSSNFHTNFIDTQIYYCLLPSLIISN